MFYSNQYVLYYTPINIMFFVVISMYLCYVRILNPSMLNLPEVYQELWRHFSTWV